jgi:hypothetical protein
MDQDFLDWSEGPGYLLQNHYQLRTLIQNQIRPFQNEKIVQFRQFYKILRYIHIGEIFLKSYLGNFVSPAVF